MKKSFATIALMLSIGLVGCTTHRFIPTGMSANLPTGKDPNCNPKVLLRSPDNVPYTEIGICMAQSPGGGMISDKTPEAIMELQKCACLNGGDAIVLTGTGEGGVYPGFGGYSQQVAKAQGVVILLNKIINQ